MQKIILVLSVSMMILSGKNLAQEGRDLYENSGSTYEEVEQFLISLKRAIRANDRDKISTLIHYPIGPFVDGKQLTIRNAQEFLGNYEQVFSDRVKRAVLEQEPDELFSSWRGLMIGRGEMWLGGICDEEHLKGPKPDCPLYIYRISDLVPVKQN